MSAPANQPAIVVMARTPVPGATKTRLQKSLTPKECAELHQAFLLDILDLARSFKQAVIFLAYTPARQRQFFEDLLSGAGHLLTQRGNNLGQRMSAAMQAVFLQGYSPVVIMGSDSPTLPSECLKKAFAVLKRAEICLGPSEDGGYYLIGMRRLHKKLFAEIPWGTDNVLASTVAAAQQAGLKTSLLPEWYDVDTPADLERLRREIAVLKTTRGSLIPHRTASILEKIFGAEKPFPAAGRN